MQKKHNCQDTGSPPDRLSFFVFRHLCHWNPGLGVFLHPNRWCFQVSNEKNTAPGCLDIYIYIRIYKGWNCPATVSGDYFINHHKDPVINPTSIFMESRICFVFPWLKYFFLQQKCVCRNTPFLCRFRCHVFFVRIDVEPWNINSNHGGRSIYPLAS